MNASEPPTHLPKLIAILKLRVLQLTQDEVCSILHCGKAQVVEVEQWFKKAPFEQAMSLCTDENLRKKANTMLKESISEGGEFDIVALAMEVGGVSVPDIMRHYRPTEYLKTKAQKKAGIDELFVAALREHYDELAQASELLVARIEGMLCHKEKHVKSGDLVQFISGNVFESKATGTLLPGRPQPEEEHLYKVFPRVNLGLTACLLAHYKDHFGKPPFSGSWEKAPIDKCNMKLAQNLRMLAQDKDFKFCADCPRCKAIKG